jgi:hypothetical protein
MKETKAPFFTGIIYDRGTDVAYISKSITQMSPTIVDVDIDFDDVEMLPRFLRNSEFLVAGKLRCENPVGEVVHGAFAGSWVWKITLAEYYHIMKFVELYEDTGAEFIRMLEEVGMYISNSHYDARPKAGHSLYMRESDPCNGECCGSACECKSTDHDNTPETVMFQCINCGVHCATGNTICPSCGYSFEDMKSKEDKEMFGECGFVDPSSTLYPRYQEFMRRYLSGKYNVNDADALRDTLGKCESTENQDAEIDVQVYEIPLSTVFEILKKYLA